MAASVPLTSYVDKRPMNLKQFEVVKVLAEKKDSGVVLAYDRAAGLNVAVKLILIRRVGKILIDDVTIEDMMLEKEAMEKLTGCEWFAQCYFTALTLSHAWFCLKYYPGGSLDDLIKNSSAKKTKLTFRDAQYILAELVCAVGEMHSHGILHRDIKEDNVMIDEEGHMVLIDFGLSVVLDTTKPLQKQVCHDDLAAGWPHVAPEAEDTFTTYSYPADRYSLGVLVGTLCKKCVLDESSWSSDRIDAAVELEAALTKKKPRKRATIKDVTSHRFFEGIRWEDVKARKLDMSNFRPTDTETQKPNDELYSFLGDRTVLSDDTPDLIDSELRDFCSFARYRDEIQKE